MNKLFKTILIFSIVVFGATLFSVGSTQATESSLISVEFENDPLFNQANFLPGEAVERYVDVENISGATQTIKVEFTNTSVGPGNALADALEVVVKKEGNPEIYTKTLTQFFDEGKLVLSELTAGANERYLFSITFLPQSGDEYQGLTVGFDLHIGLFGEEPSEEEEEEEEETNGGDVVSGGGFAGGGSTYGLEIYNEDASGTDEPYLVTITWTTNKDATSRVIYSSEFEPHILQLNSPSNYGYIHSTLEDSTKTQTHSVILSGLEPDLTYFYRCVSHTSPEETISTEHTFTMPLIEETEEGEEEEEEEEEEPVMGEEEEEEEEEPAIGEEEEEEESVMGEEEEEEEEEKEEEEGITEIGEETGPNMFLAAIGNTLSFGSGKAWLAILIGIIILVILIWIINYLIRKSRRKNLK